MKAEPNPAALARAEKQRQTAIEGKANLEAYEAEGAAARRNMERLRALRLAKEASDRAAAVEPVSKAGKLRRRSSLG
jgi:hypothetical protein